MDRLARAELLAGLTEVTGPGLIVNLRPCPRAPKGVDPKDLVVLDEDVNAILMALRAAGAEALAISGAGQKEPERILVTSAARAEDEGMRVNNTKLLPPYRILAIGNSSALRTELLRPGGVAKKSHLEELQMIELVGAAKLVIPAYRRAVEPRFARVPEPVVAAAAKSEAPPAAEPPVEQRELPAPATPSGVPAQPAPAKEAAAPPPGSVLPNRVVAVVPRTRGAAPAVPTSLKSPAPMTEAAPAPVKPEQPETKPEAPAANPEPVAPKKEPFKERAPRPIVKAPVTPPAAPMPAADLGLFGGKGLAKYHAAGCRFGERIEKGDRVFFHSAEAARQAGRVPCSICLPEGTSHASSR